MSLSIVKCLVLCTEVLTTLSALIRAAIVHFLWPNDMRDLCVTRIKA